ncbi:MAG: hypothetical protein ACHQHO_08825 [Solirubrobacterales bacterium]
MRVRHTTLYVAFALAVMVVVGLGRATSSKSSTDPPSGYRPLLSQSSVVISDTGAIGRLHLGVSTAADVVAFAGSPEAEDQGEERSGEPYRELGYECRPAVLGRVDLTHIELVAADPRQACRTVYFVDLTKGELALLATTSGRFRDGHGIRVGMATRTADRRAHKRAIGGCLDALRFRTRKASLTALIYGAGRPVVRRLAGGSTELVVKGGHVGELWLVAASDELGVADCIDS